MTYTPVAEVAGAGNSNMVLNYSAVDEHPLIGVSYYRLRKTNDDDQSTFSRVVVIDVKKDVTLGLYPNPARTNLQLTFTAENGGPVVTRIVDAGGRIVGTYNFSSTTGVNTQTFNVAGYHPGTYYMQLITNTNNSAIPFSIF